jgi:alpha-D-ribose 1-methylphosphonate 5-triphosphate synthase subunit PhnL
MTAPTTPRIRINRLDKTFVLHNQGGVTLPVLQGISLDVLPGECVVLSGPSGTGKSTLLRCMYGNYLTAPGAVAIWNGEGWVDLGSASPQQLLELRRTTLGYVSQFLRVIPRIPAIEIVGEPLRRRGVDAAAAAKRSAELLRRLRIPERLWNLPPATFSGGEQQRINIARGFCAGYPVMLLDEPTAALDEDNRATVVELIGEARAGGTAVVGIFHDESVREAVGTRRFDLTLGQAA